MRQMKRWTIALVTIVLAAVAGGARATEDKMAGAVVLQRLGQATLHTYVSPEAGGTVTSHVIESQHKLVVVDAQMVRPYSGELRAYVDGLGKPIDRIIISHAHPDHWFGLESFRDVPSYALSDTIAEIEKYGDMMIAGKKKALGEIVPDAKTVPGHTLNLGETEIDGLRYRFEQVRGGEGSQELVIRLPELGAVIAQDLVYNRVHLWLGQNDLPGWARAVDALAAVEGYPVVLGGHGEPGGPELYDSVRHYLKAGTEALQTAKSGADLKAALVPQFPGYRAAFLHDIAAQYLFPQR